MMTDSSILSVDDLRVSFPSPRDTIEVIRGISFSVGRERLGIVGESGSGKTITARALLRILPAGARLTAKSMRFQDLDLLNADGRTMRGIRGRRISMIMQDPKFSLNPVKSVGTQIAEMYRVHAGESRTRARARALEMLAAVRIRDPERVYGLFPHEVSGGMGQRIMIAIMIATDPELLIADEPTSALDVTIQLQVLGLIDRLVEERNMGLIFISHDLTLVSTFCDRVLVMLGGRIMEDIAAANLRNASHPYTRHLLAASPVLGDQRPRLPVIRQDPDWFGARNSRERA